MDRLVISRKPSTDQGTPGTAELLNAAGIELWVGVDMELPDRGNAPDISRILAGVYVAKYYFSSLFGRNVYHLQDVPGRTSVEVHIGNFAGDKSLGWYSDVLGCTVLGTEIGKLVPPHPGYTRPQTACLNSTVAYDAFVAATGGADIEVEYRDEPDQTDVA